MQSQTLDLESRTPGVCQLHGPFRDWAATGSNQPGDLEGRRAVGLYVELTGMQLKGGASCLNDLWENLLGTRRGQSVAYLLQKSSQHRARQADATPATNETDKEVPLGSKKLSQFCHGRT